MAYSVNWATKVVTIPKSDTTLVSVSPDVRQLDIEDFWKAIIDIEDSDEAMAFPPIIENTAPKALFSLTLARTVLVINGYSITFEDGLYSINIVGGNSNLDDPGIVNKNSVGVNTKNSAGLIVVAGATAPVDFDALMDNQEIEPGFTMRAAMRLMLTALAGPVAGGAGPVVEFRNVTDTKTRITSTADEHGNRNPVTYDVSD